MILPIRHDTSTTSPPQPKPRCFIVLYFASLDCDIANRKPRMPALRDLRCVPIRTSHAPLPLSFCLNSTSV
ncbi:uncharacterized protein CLUP02_10649 [Colletotrichum lupini]|uniref:Uncharacterized protein n=3 Tax=Colletotrichum acutatum species complex TaxID=2707335 RepID=A0A9Q8SX56_9PEZI|nr:uncharacterized protein CLUP02_10649 [Colletotrichum lupini]XP_060388293.1 uncharacterized protein CTAM01_00784 [Colletotrichum tamarilloi]KAI3529686.1 hypothetical protein CSPX01_15325 [Colletotrichum filicis]KAK1476982.1 hypothetical protein CCUS01_16698 [Colletotrichum cuscutae]KAK1511854.1 hypothetical protein CTAM01_00784 [Colletotrichum tamarilloi]KAK1715861.1 hypothetical protein BDP67DRAFT_289581 [Colletotrichum lupini]UQC85153.1 hypothetical protein CLUP02_10649 [Colletotrichum lu